MADFPALPIWTDAYIADTMHLDCTESGAYFHLLMAAWRSKDCSLPDDDKILARMAKASPRVWKRIKDAVMAFWDYDEETHKWTQKRLLKERTWVSDKRHKQSRAGKASALKRQHSVSTDVGKTLQHNANETPTPIPIPTPIEKKDTKVSKKKDDSDDKPKRRTRLNADWEPDEKCCEYARERGHDPHKLAEQFANYHRAKGTTMLDWNAAWRTWVGNADRFGGSKDGRSGNGGQNNGGVVAAVRNNLNRIRDRQGLQHDWGDVDDFGF